MLQTEHYLEFLSLKGGCTGLSESTLVRMSHCWKSHVVAQMSFYFCVGACERESSKRLRQDCADARILVKSA